MTWSLDALAKRSVEVIESGQGPGGGFLASPTFPNYRYSWFRDGSFIADAMSRAGRADSAEAFFGWCVDIIESRLGTITRLVSTAGADGPESVAIGDHLHTRYTLDGRESDGEWWNFQLDGYGTWLWALGAHAGRYELGLERFRLAIEATVEYLAAFWTQPSYDWWEENRHERHVATLAAIWAGLTAAVTLDGVAPHIVELAMTTAASIRGVVDGEGVSGGRLVKWLGGDDIDASLLASITPFAMFPADGPVAKATIAEVEDRLTTGGVHRYPGDTFYGGGAWVLLAGFLGWSHLEAGDPERASELARWMADQADIDGHLPEQVPDPMLHPHRRAEWEDRWGPSARPLLWSHAMFLTLVVEAGVASKPVTRR